MNTEPQHGYFCFFTKLELSQFKNDRTNDFMILQSSAEPGYYSKANFPVNQKKQHDHHLYLVVKKTAPCFQDMVLRKSNEIIRQHNLAMHVCPGQLNLFNSNYQCIRIHLADMDTIDPLIEGLTNEGIAFLKQKNVKPFYSFIQHKKYIEFDKIEDGVYQDSNVPNRHFIQIPYPVDYKRFEKLVEEIKYSCKYNHFDASLAYLNQGENTFDFVSVYSDHCDISKLKEFKQHIDRLLK